jgi:glycosyltransferase involved in cell wall biosynthesis
VREIFVLPGDRRARTGGNLYNRFLIAALRAEGMRVSTMTLEEALGHARSGRPARYWIDMLLMAVPRLRARSGPRSRCYLMVHYFPSLQWGLTPRARAQSRRSEDAAFAAADGFLVTSAFSGTQLAGRGVRGKPVMNVPPAPAVAPTRPPSPRASHECRVLMVANVTPGKGVLEFLRGLHEHLSQDSRFSLEIAGSLDADRAYAARCRRVVDRSAMLRERVRWLGPLPPAALRRAYARNAFFVSASYMESFGMALLEARTFGLHVLTLRAGNAPSHVTHSSVGEVLESMDALSARIAALAADGAMRERLLRRMKPPAKAATWRECARRFLAQLPRIA